jgi:hypothetical protein
LIEHKKVMIKTSFLKKPSVQGGLVLLWLVLTGIGFFLLWRYENTAGSASNPPPEWPRESSIALDTSRPTLVLLAHPQCPCTRASLNELAVLMARCQNKVKVYVLFFKPSGFPEGWETSDLWESAERIPGVVVKRDEDGVEATRFQATTSGQAVLYDTSGQLLFHGGISASRGHSGDNKGRETIVALLNQQDVERRETLVFGCPLVDRESQCKEEEKICNK